MSKTYNPGKLKSRTESTGNNKNSSEEKDSEYQNTKGIIDFEEIFSSYKKSSTNNIDSQEALSTFLLGLEMHAKL